MTLEPLLKPAAVAPMLGCSPRHVRLLCQLGRIRHEAEVSPGGRRRYYIPESAVEAYRARRVRAAV